MSESPRFERPTAPEEGEELFSADEKSALYLERSNYLLEQLGQDLLTGLKNRIFFEHELEHSLKMIRGRGERHHRSGEEPLKQFAVLFIDLDNFKQVNDTRGHNAGDEALIKVANLLGSAVRESDVVARFGGDEFYILLPRAGEKDAVTIATKIQQTLENDPLLKELGVTASIGVRPVDASNAVDSKTLITHADTATYAAKKKGKNTVKIYTET